MSRESRIEIWRDAWRAVARSGRLWLVQFFGAAALAAVAYAWLWIPESSATELLGSTILALLIASLAMWLFAGSLASFDSVHGGEPRPIFSVFRSRLRSIPALLVWTVAWGLILWLISPSDERVSSWAGTLASWLTLHLRRPISPEATGAFLDRAHWWLDWWLIPLLVVPFGYAASRAGFGGFRWTAIRGTFRILGRLTYWIGASVLFLIGGYGPSKLLGWVPEVHSLTTEFASLAVRFLLAYLLAVTAWLATLSLLSRVARASEAATPFGGPAPASPDLSRSPGAAEPGE